MSPVLFVSHVLPSWPNRDGSSVCGNQRVRGHPSTFVLHHSNWFPSWGELFYSPLVARQFFKQNSINTAINSSAKTARPSYSIYSTYQYWISLLSFFQIAFKKCMSFSGCFSFYNDESNYGWKFNWNELNIDEIRWLRFSTCLKDSDLFIFLSVVNFCVIRM